MITDLHNLPVAPVAGCYVNGEKPFCLQETIVSTRRCCQPEPPSYQVSLSMRTVIVHDEAVLITSKLTTK